jgi:uncharacterized RDD family membrane protein YckC
MASQVLFETPENVQIAYRTAGLGTRYCAWALDCLFVILVAIGISFAALVLGAAADVSVDSLSRKLGVRSPVSQQEFTAFCLAFGMLAMQLGSLIYFTASELFVRGQTYGKRTCGLRVVKADGFALDAGSVLVRNVFRLVDQIPVLWIVPLLSSRSQRFGDMVSGTLVVAETEDGIGDLRARLTAREAAESRFRFDSAMLNRTRPTDVEALEQILDRWPMLTDRQRTILMDRMVEPLAKRLAAASPSAADREEFLFELLSAIYRRESRRLG